MLLKGLKDESICICSSSLLSTRVENLISFVWTKCYMLHLPYISAVKKNVECLYYGIPWAHCF